MKREEIAQSLARQAQLSSAAARDEVDAVVHRILQKLRRGRAVKIPGIGKLAPNPSGRR